GGRTGPSRLLLLVLVRVGRSRRLLRLLPIVGRHADLDVERVRLAAALADVQARDGDRVPALFDPLEKLRDRVHAGLLQVNDGAALGVHLPDRDRRMIARVADLELLRARRLLDEARERRGRLRVAAGDRVLLRGPVAYPLPRVLHVGQRLTELGVALAAL